MPDWEILIDEVLCRENELTFGKYLFNTTHHKKDQEIKLAGKSIY